MRAGRGKRTAIRIVASCLLALAAAAVLLRDAILEGWSIRALRSSDPEVRLAAVDELARRMSVRAVPHLIRCLADGPLEEVELESGVPGGLSRRSVRFTPVLHAIHTIGEGGRPAVEAAIRENRGVWLRGRYNVSWLLTHVVRAWDGEASAGERLEWSMAGDGEDR